MKKILLALVAAASLVSGPASAQVVPSTLVRNFANSVTLTTATLASNAVFTSAWTDASATGQKTLDVSVYADQGGSFVIQQSDDTANSNLTLTTPCAPSSFNACGNGVYTYTAATASYSTGAVFIGHRFWRLVYTNGATTQTTFEIAATASQMSRVVIPSNTTIGFPAVTSSATTVTSPTLNLNQGQQSCVLATPSLAGGPTATVYVGDANGNFVVDPLYGAFAPAGGAIYTIPVNGYASVYVQFTSNSGAMTYSFACSTANTNQILGTVNSTISGTVNTNVTNPAPTSAPGGQYATQNYCPASASTMGTTTYSCVSDASGNQGFNGGRDSTGTGAANRTFIFNDNPANGACNTSAAGLPCVSTLTTTTMTAVISPGSAKRIYLTGVTAVNTSSALVNLTLYWGTSTCSVSQQTVAILPLAANGGGIVWPLSLTPYAILPTNSGLCATLSASATSVYLTLQFAQF